MAQDTSRADLDADLLDFSPENLLESDPSSEYQLFGVPDNSSVPVATFDVMNGSMPAPTESNGTVSPQDIWTEPLSAPPSTALTNLSTPGTTFESPWGIHSTDTSPLMRHDLDEGSPEWPSLFPDQNPSDDIQPTIEPAAQPMSRDTSSGGPQLSMPRHSSVAGVKHKSRRVVKPLADIIKYPTDSPEILKRKRNTEAARKSRAKRQNAMEALQAQVDDLQYQVYHWRTIAETGRAPSRHPSLEDVSQV